jgi:hypothetical protein
MGAHDPNRVDRRNPAFRAAAIASIKRWNANQKLLPRCGANRKHGAGPCQQPGLGSGGRCRWHGGAVPRGDAWHRPVWPKGNTPAAARKLHAKLRALEKAAKARAARLSEMTEEELAAHRKWHAERPVGSAAKRAEVKRLKDQANSARRLFLKGTTREALEDAEYLAICDRIAELRAKLKELHADQTRAPVSGPATLTEGVFG